MNKLFHNCIMYSRLTGSVTLKNLLIQLQLSVHPWNSAYFIYSYLDIFQHMGESQNKNGAKFVPTVQLTVSMGILDCLTIYKTTLLKNYIILMFKFVFII